MTRMSVEQYLAAVARACEARDSTSLELPNLLTKAAVEVMPVDGVGLSLTEGLRVPLGQSSKEVTQAERLQTTLGEGPCLTAVGSSKPLVADLATIAARWPMFHRDLTSQTPFRSIASVPLHLSAEAGVGAMDFYSTAPDAEPLYRESQLLEQVARLVSSLLFATPKPSTELGWSRWLNGAAVSARLNVWAAEGVLIASSGLTNDDALAALRAYAFSHSLTLDEVAEQVTTKQLAPQEFVDSVQLPIDLEDPLMTTLVSVSVSESAGTTTCRFEWGEPIDLIAASVGWMITATSADGNSNAQLGYKLISGRFAGQYVFDFAASPMQRNYPANAEINETAMWFTVPELLSNIVGPQAHMRGVIQVGGQNKSGADASFRPV